MKHEWRDIMREVIPDDDRWRDRTQADWDKEWDELLADARRKDEPLRAKGKRLRKLLAALAYVDRQWETIDGVTSIKDDAHYDPPPSHPWHGYAKRIDDVGNTTIIWLASGRPRRIHLTWDRFGGCQASLEPPALWLYDPKNRDDRHDLKAAAIILAVPKVQLSKGPGGAPHLYDTWEQLLHEIIAVCTENRLVKPTQEQFCDVWRIGDRGLRKHLKPFGKTWTKDVRPILRRVAKG